MKSRFFESLRLVTVIAAFPFELEPEPDDPLPARLGDARDERRARIAFRGRRGPGMGADQHQARFPNN